MWWMCLNHNPSGAAANLCLDWRWLHPTAWCYWQVMDPSAGWGTIRYDAGTLNAGAVETKYYVLAQFTRHIRPGMRIIDTGAGKRRPRTTRPPAA